MGLHSASAAMTRVRILIEHRSIFINPYEQRTFMPGEEVDLVWTCNWWTTYDLDAAHIVPAAKVEVVGSQPGTPP